MYVTVFHVNIIYIHSVTQAVVDYTNFQILLQGMLFVRIAISYSSYNFLAAIRKLQDLKYLKIGQKLYASIEGFGEPVTYTYVAKYQYCCSALQLIHISILTIHLGLLGELINIVTPQIQAEWRVLADYLDYPPDVVQTIHHTGKDSGSIHCCNKFFIDWYHSDNGVRPCSWETLAGALRHARFGDVSSNIEMVKSMCVLATCIIILC